jgi:hypothetical protein
MTIPLDSRRTAKPCHRMSYGQQARSLASSSNSLRFTSLQNMRRQLLSFDITPQNMGDTPCMVRPIFSAVGRRPSTLCCFWSFKSLHYASYAKTGGRGIGHTREERDGRAHPLQRSRGKEQGPRSSPHWALVAWHFLAPCQIHHGSTARLLRGTVPKRNLGESRQVAGARGERVCPLQV